MKKRYTCTVIGVLVSGAFLYGTSLNFSSGISETAVKAAESIASPPKTVEVSPIILVEAMREDFESITFRGDFTAERVASGRCNGNWLQNLAYRDCYIANVPGTVSAGFGEKILNQEQFVVDHLNKTITYHLGKPSIREDTGVVIHHNRIMVLNPDDWTGWLVRPDKGLSNKANHEAKTKLRKAACRAHIYESAGLSAEKKYGRQLRSILRVMEKTDYAVSIVYDIPKCKK